MDSNGRFFIFKTFESRFGEKFPKSALFYCKNLSQSFWRFFVRYAELVEIKYLDWFGFFLFLFILLKRKDGDANEENHIQCSAESQGLQLRAMQIEVEKVIFLYGKRFEQMRDHPLDDAPEIMESRDLMYREGNIAHCILVLDANGDDGILVEAEGADYARKSEFFSNARAIIEQSEFTAGERQLHAGLHNRAVPRVEVAGLSDAQLYKQAGNAVTVSVVEAIAGNLLQFDKEVFNAQSCNQHHRL